jgi:hypothetical protein
MTMNILRQFRLNDSIREKLVFKNIDEKEFNKRLSLLTDQTTNVGFLTKGKQFHGVLTEDKFRLKKLRTLNDEEFTIKGQILKKDNELIVNIEFIRGPLFTLLPTFLLILGTILIIKFIQKETFDIRYLPFILIGALIILWGLGQKRENEFNKVKNIFHGLYRAGE